MDFNGNFKGPSYYFQGLPDYKILWGVKLWKNFESPSYSLRKKCQYLEFFWSVFSHIRNEYVDLPLNLQIKSECRKIRSRKTPNTHTFYAVTKGISDKSRVDVRIMKTPKWMR